MSYKHIEGIDKSDRARRRRQEVGGRKVSRYAWSPYTAIPRVQYDWYADITFAKPIVSPTVSGDKEQDGQRLIKGITVYLITGTFLEFRDSFLSGEIYDRIIEVVESKGAELGSIDGYWRST